MSSEFESSTPTPEDALADTNPMRPVSVPTPLPAWRHMLGLISLVGALLLTLGSMLLIALPAAPPEPAPALPTLTMPTDTTEVIEAPTQSDVTAPIANAVVGVEGVPTLSPENAAALLAQPVTPAPLENGITFIRNANTPFTRVPDRPRTEVIEYEVVSGDTMFTIAERFGLQPESIAWSNPRSIIGSLRPGLRIKIPPIDGAVELIANDRTIASLAEGYGVDPFAIIDWESNGLFGAAPETTLISGMNIFIPGGVGEQVSWNPVVERTGGDSSGAGGTISFAVGDPGSCGPQPNSGGFGGWVRPLNSAYTFIRGFSGIHFGVDLAVPVGTPVSAALGGTVIFQGWNNWGYGYAVVLAHGPFTTIYGHLSEIYVGCGQSVAPGTVIGGSGNTGNSSGPHLHFEVRFNDQPIDPTTILAF